MKNVLTFLLSISLFILSVSTTLPRVYAQQTSRSVVTLPFEAVPQHGGPVITVRLNHSVTARLLIDTGSNSIAVTPEIASKLKLKPETRREDGLKSIKVTDFEISNWNLPGGELRVLEGDLIPTLRQLNVDGVLGTGLLGTCALLLNFEKQECCIVYPGNLPAGEVEKLGFGMSNAVTAPLIQDAAGFAYSVEVQVADKSAPLLLDTGHSQTVLPNTFIKAVGSTPVMEGRLQGLNEIMTNPVYIVSGLKAGDAQGSRQSIMVARSDKGDHTRILGMDFLAQFNLLIDFPAKRMYLNRLAKTNASLDSNHQLNVEGMILGAGEGTWKVVSLNKTNRLYRAGLRQGDSIDSVNQVDLKGLLSSQVVAKIVRPGSVAFGIRRLVDGVEQKRVVLVTAAN